MLKAMRPCVYLTAFLFAVSFARAADKNVCNGDPNQWKQLFDGKDLNGWKHVGPGHMTVEDGLIHTHGGMGLLYWTGGPIDDCTLHVVFRMRDENDNSGVFVRIPVEPREEWMPVHYGYEVQIDNHPERSSPLKTSTTPPACCIRSRNPWRRRGSRDRSGTRWTSPWMARAPS